MKRFARIVVLIGLVLLLGISSAYAAAGLPDPYAVAISSGGSVIPKTAYVSATANGDNTIVSAVSGKRIVVWYFEISPSVAANVYWKSGATQNSEIVYMDALGGWARGPIATYRDVTPALVTNSGEALILTTNNVGPTGVFVKYTEE